MEVLEREVIPIKIIAGDRRLTMRLMGLWQDLRVNDHCTRLEDFPASLPDDLSQDCFIAVPDGAGGRGELHRIGAMVAESSNIVAESSRISELPVPSLLETAVRCLDQVMIHTAPLLDEGDFEDGQGRRILFRAILLPLVDDSNRIVQILGGARCKVCADNA